MSTLNLLVLRCKDIERSRAFYENFEMSFVKHAHGSGPEHYAHQVDNTIFELYPSASATPDEMTALGFRVADLNKTCALLSERGFKPGARKQTEWGETVVVRDPDGRRVELKGKSER